MIELHFYSGKAYNATFTWEDENCHVSVGTDADGKHIAVIQLPKLGIYLVGDEELYDNCNGQPPSQYQIIALEFILKRLTPEKFCEFLPRLVEDQYKQGYANGKDGIQKALQDLLGIGDLFS